MMTFLAFAWLLFATPDNPPRPVTAPLRATGLEFLRMCEGTSDGEAGRALCEAYLRGFWTATNIFSALDQRPDRKALCFPKEGLPGDQIRLIVVKWLKDHPTRLQQHPDVLNFGAIFDAYGCGPK